MTAAIALQKIGSDCIRIIAAVAIAAIVFATMTTAVAAAMVVGDSGTGGGISASRNTADCSKNIMNGTAATATTAAKIMSDGSVVTASSNSNLL